MAKQVLAHFLWVVRGLLDQQQQLLEQSQLGSVPRIAPLITAWAQPTPFPTEIASAGQLF